MAVFRLHSFERDVHLTLRSGRSTAVTYAVTAEGTGTRLTVRVVFAMAPGLVHALVVGDLVMMRKQLRTLRALAEGTAPAR